MAAPQTTAPLMNPFRFMDLATELRLMVYKRALSSNVTLRSPKHLEVRNNRHGQRVRQTESLWILNIDILVLSKKVFTEAIPVFYDVNRFNYTILPHVPHVQSALRNFTMHLHLMQHVSIDYMLHTIASHVSEVDRLVTARVRSVIDGCPNLRTFTLHLLTYYSNEELHQRLPADSQTALELSRLVPRLKDPTDCLDWIAIVTHGNHRALAGLRDGIAPTDEWVVRKPAEWPDISIDDYQKRGIERREDDNTCQKIRMFYLWPDMRSRVAEREERGRREGHLESLV